MGSFNYNYIDTIIGIAIDIVFSFLYSLTSCKITSKILKESYYWLTVCLAILYVWFLFFGSKKRSALIFIVNTDFFTYANDT